MHNISVSVVYATQTKQFLKETVVPRGTSALELVIESGVLKDAGVLDQFEANEFKLGVYAQPVADDYLLQEGDRVEVYRMLKADPKEVRRQLAKLGKTMGKK